MDVSVCPTNYGDGGRCNANVESDEGFERQEGVPSDVVVIAHAITLVQVTTAVRYSVRE